MLYQFAALLVAWALRDYGVEGQLGLEPTFEEYIDKLCAIYDEVRRVLRKDGTCWVNLGDTYGTQSGNSRGKDYSDCPGTYMKNREAGSVLLKGNIPHKSLCLIPQRFAIKMVEHGWILRNVIIWCLGAGTRLYVRSQKGDMPMTIKDMARLDPKTVKLWDGQRWTQLKRIEKQQRADGLQITLRSGEVITCTPEHKWPTQRGLIESKNLKVGDVFDNCRLPEKKDLQPRFIPDHIGWLLGFYLAEGSIDTTGTIQLSVHKGEIQSYKMLKEMVEDYGGTCRKHDFKGNASTICIDSKILLGLIRTYISGKGAKNKHLSVKCWQRNDFFLRCLLTGYLEGDGHQEKKNNRWRLGFTRNYNLEQDLRTICARLGLPLTLNKSISQCEGKDFKSFRGEIRTGGAIKQQRNKIVKIEKAKGRIFYEIGVEDEPHLFSLASGVLTHNSKPNPMPSSAKDRFTVDFEQVYFFVKSKKYWFETQYETIVCPANGRPFGAKGNKDRTDIGNKYEQDNPLGRNKRTTWTIPTQPFSEWGETYHWERVALGEASCGTMHIVSLNCPVCGGLFGQVAKQLYGELGHDLLSRISRIYSHPVFSQVPDFSHIDQNRESSIWLDSLGSFAHECFLSATSRSIESRKMALFLSTNSSCKIFAETFFHIDDKLERLLFFVLQMHIHGNSILPDEMDVRLQGQIPSRIVGKSSSLNSLKKSKCICAFYNKVTEKSSHFATFPDALVEPMIKAGCPEFVCKKCGKARVKIYETNFIKRPTNDKPETYKNIIAEQAGDRSQCIVARQGVGKNEHTFKGHTDCGCGAGFEGGIALDPFCGTATVCKVAAQLGRNYIGIDLNPEYVEKFAIPKTRAVETCVSVAEQKQGQGALFPPENIESEKEATNGKKERN